MSGLPEPKRDTTRSSKMQWFVLDCAFTSEEDAKSAIKLALTHEKNVRDDLWYDTKQEMELL